MNPVLFPCLRCGTGCIEDYTEIWEVEVPCLWCPECEATYPLLVEEVEA